jgi:regulator of sigma E protease
MSFLLTAIAVVIIFSVLVLVHEYGHFMAARRAGIKVLEFGIGFPPRLFKKKVGETIYSINAIPLGGFVRLLGEEATDEKALTNKRSYSAQSPWTRTKVVLAGVCMNFILAILLLTIGFSFGIEPLLVTEDDLFNHLALGNVVTAPGFFVSSVADSASKLGISAGDKILAINDKAIMEVAQVEVLQKGKATKDIDVTLLNPKGQVKKIHMPLASGKTDFGVTLKPFTEFPRLTILEVKPKSLSSKAGLKVGDVILRMNSQEVYMPADFETILSESGSVNFSILRGNNIQQINVTLPDTKHVVIADVFSESAASKAGFKVGDIIISINGTSVAKPEDVQDILKKNPGKELVYKIFRNAKEESINAKSGEGNLLGVALSHIASYRNTEISVYRSTVLTSITEIKKVRYNPWVAFKQAVSESIRLTGYTAQAFGKTIGSIVSKFAVPEEIGGPVQIAYYTHAFIQEGFFALLRFTALLSLSLGVINVLPIPALDGGKLLFIVAEVITGKKINEKFESTIHLIGFVLLLLLIVLVTYSDIMRLF